MNSLRFAQLSYADLGSIKWQIKAIKTIDLYPISSILYDEFKDESP